MDDPTTRDRGFTLVETIVVILLVSVLASVMVAVIAVIYRNAPSTEARADNSRSYRGLATWLPRDVASTPPSGFSPPSPPSGRSCSGVTGTSLVEMTWEQLGEVFVAGYTLQVDGDGQLVSRYLCSGPTAQSVFTNTSTLDMTGRLHDADIDPINPADPLVRMRLTTCGETDGQTDCAVAGPELAVEAASRNPGDALPS